MILLLQYIFQRDCEKRAIVANFLRMYVTVDVQLKRCNNKTTLPKTHFSYSEAFFLPLTTIPRDPLKAYRLT